MPKGLVWRAGTIVLVLGATLGMVGVRAGAEGGADSPPRPAPPPSPRPDDFPVLRRILLPQDRLAAELERARQGVLVRMPLAEFEERVRRAREAAQQAAAQPTRGPRLDRAHYRAALVEEPRKENGPGPAEPYLSGSATWKVGVPA